MAEKERSVSVSVRFDGEIMEELQKRADQNGMTKTDLVRTVVLDYLARDGGEADANSSPALVLETLLAIAEDVARTKNRLTTAAAATLEALADMASGGLDAAALHTWTETHLRSKLPGYQPQLAVGHRRKSPH